MRHLLARLRHEDGFSLTELLVVLVIIGILVALLALPRFMTVTTRAKATEAKMMLSQLYTLQQAYYLEYSRYADALGAVGFEQASLTTDGGRANYRITIDQAQGSQFRALATAVVDFDNDGTFNVWAVDQTGQVREQTPD